MVTAIFLLGPPASGKSTLSRQLESRHHARTFRLREYAGQRARTDPALAAVMRRRADPLGWLPDRTAVVLVRDAVSGQFQPAVGSPVVFEGYPGNGYQADYLARLLSALRLPSLALVLRLPPQAARQRAEARRVCPACTAEDGEPHRPARLAENGRCADCGAPAQRRDSDEPQRLAARAARFLQHLPSIRTALTAQDVPWRTIDAELPPALLLAAAEAELHVHLPKGSTP
ncbi:AAA family ATPase [Kitasatospora sp. NBC_01287]|uniref:AAA family ATPase n=1 Tax=Kitasatospora sp. NBC_01287 TaxID=2903573 RepID=UPI0022579EDE|nr:AAA family ATPase [Kitasatospora sp. NBC_01287]MCX4745541.1 AAA family ATPase [Kitasatospora sp. NBC_01287]